MKRYWILIALAAVLVIGAGPWIWNTIISPKPQLDLSPLKYNEDSSWSALPVQDPAPVWRDGWGVDVFLVSKDSALRGKSQSGLQKRERKAREQAQALKASLQEAGEVYAPLYRDNARNDDVTRAFETYLRRDNKGRALILAHDVPLPPSVLGRLEQDENLRERFGGFLSISDTRQGIPSLKEDAGESSEDTPLPYCTPRLVEADSCQMIVPAHKVKGLWVIAEEGVPGGETIAEFPAWLEENVGKMAEPLGDFEEVEIVDIRRPGDTDERREKEDDN